MTNHETARRETVEYFVQCQQPDGTWEQASSTATDLDFANERLAARRRMLPEFVYRIAQRTTVVVVGPVDAAAVSVPPPAPRADAAPVAEVWVVWREDQPPYGYFATEDAAKHATIDYWEEDEPVCPDYSWRKDGPRWELVVGGEHGGVYASRHRVYGAPVPPPVDRGAVLREVADWAYRIARRLDDQHRDERAQGAWDVENALRAELRRLAAVSGPPPAPQATDRRARYAAAIAEGFRAFDADTTSDAYLDAELLDAVVAVADAEEAELLAAVSVVPPAPRADDRAAVLRWAADDLATAFGDPMAKHIGALGAAHLRRRAREIEAGQAGEEQPETPLEKRLRYSERRNDELRAECKRRGKRVLERSEKIRALEREVDEVRRQLGAEILRAGQAEGELRRLTAEAPTTTKPETLRPDTNVWTFEGCYDPDNDKWHGLGGTYSDHDEALDAFKNRAENDTARDKHFKFRLVRATTTYTVEAEHVPAAEVQDGAAS